MQSLLPENETERLATLHDLNILDTPFERVYDDLVHLAATLIKAPIALISLIDAERQWFKSVHGLDVCETSRAISFCSHAILRPDPLVVPDATKDPRFRDNPAVSSVPGIRFYAGVPLIMPSGHAVGTLCVAGFEPRELLPQEVEILTVIARQAVQLLVLRQSTHEKSLVEQRLSEATARLHGFVDHSPTLAFMKDEAGRYVYVNKTYELRLGISASDILGRTDFDFHSAELSAQRAGSDRIVLESGSAIEVTEWVPMPSGESYHLTVHKFPFEDSAGNRFVGGIAFDITDRKLAEAAVQDRELLLRSFYDSAPVMLGIVETEEIESPASMEIIHVSGNKAAGAVFGKTAEEMCNLRTADLGTPPERVALWLEKYRETKLLGEPVTFVFERLDPLAHREDLQALWLSATVNFIGTSEAGRDRFTYVVDDITARRAADFEVIRRRVELEDRNAELDSLSGNLAENIRLLTTASHRFQELFQGLPVACFTYDAAGSIFELNRACETLYGWEHSQLFGQTPWDTIWSQSNPERAKNLVDQVFAGQSIEEMDETIIRPDGECRHILCSTFPLSGLDGEITGAICASLDITGRKLAEQALEEQICLVQEANVQLEEKKVALEELNARLGDLAVTDGLTGLKNHRAFQQFLEEAFQRSDRYGEMLSLVLLDVDNFKMFNDAFGHPAGDRVLKTVADVLRHTAREVDFVARYGGEEFALVMPGTPQAGARDAAERIRAAVEQIQGLERSLTVSIGISTVSHSTTSRAEMIEQADEAMYSSKRGGRNMATHFLDIVEVEEPEISAAA